MQRPLLVFLCALTLGASSAAQELGSAGLTPDRAAALQRLREAPRPVPTPPLDPAEVAAPADLRELMREVYGVSEMRGQRVGYGSGYKVLFEDGRIDFRARGGHSLGLEFLSVTRGGTRLYEAAGAVAPVIDGNAVRYEHGGGLVELYDVGRTEIEQSFVFYEPLPGEGDLVVRLALSTELLRAPSSAGLRFLASDVKGERGVSIGAVTGVDAADRTAPGSLRLEGGVLELVLPHAFVAGAEYPLVLDPPIGSIDGWDVDGIEHDHSPDVAFDETNQQYLIVWISDFSATDRDLFGALHHVSGTSTGFSLDLSTEDVWNPAVGNLNDTDRFLVAYSSTLGESGSGQFEVRGLSVDAQSGAAVGTSQLAPSMRDVAGVSGDPVPGFNDAIVVWHDPISLDVSVVLVDVPATGDPTAIGSPTSVGPSSIPPATVKGIGASGHALVVRHAGLGQPLVGQIVRYDGALVGFPTTLAPFSPTGTMSYLAVDGDGERFCVAHVPWDISVGSLDLWSALAEFDGTTLFPVDSIQMDDNISTAEVSVAATNDAYVVTWTDGFTLLGSTLNKNGSVKEAQVVVAVDLGGFDVGTGIASERSATDPTVLSNEETRLAWNDAVEDSAIYTQIWSAEVEAVETPYNSAIAPNPGELLPGTTTGPRVGQVWDPMVIPGGGVLFASFPGLILSTAPVDIPGVFPGPSGTLLVTLSGPVSIVSAQPDWQLAIPIPNLSSLIGATVYAQGGYVVLPSFLVQVTSALEITIGS